MAVHHKVGKTYRAMVDLSCLCLTKPDAVMGFYTSSANREWVRNVALEAAKDVLKSAGEPVTVYRTVAGIKFSNGSEIRLI